MARVTISKAARMVGASRTTVHRYIKQGKLSKENGKIDTSELVRVFGDISHESDTGSTSANKNKSVVQLTSMERELLQQQISTLKQQVTSLEVDKNYLQERLNESMETQKLLTHQASTTWIERLVTALKGKT